MSDSAMSLLLKGYGLSTIEVFYHMPDFRHVLNTFTWQTYDLAPDYPRMFAFIEFWQREIDGPLHSVRFTHSKFLGPSGWRQIVGEFQIEKQPKPLH